MLTVTNQIKQLFANPLPPLIGFSSRIVHIYVGDDLFPLLCWVSSLGFVNLRPDLSRLTQRKQAIDTTSAYRNALATYNYLYS